MWIVFCIFLFKPSHMRSSSLWLIDVSLMPTDFFTLVKKKKVVIENCPWFLFQSLQKSESWWHSSFWWNSDFQSNSTKVQQRSLMSFSTFGPRLNIEKLVKLSNYQTIRQMPHDQESVGWNSSEFWACLSPSIISKMFP